MTFHIAEDGQIPVFGPAYFKDHRRVWDISQQVNTWFFQGLFAVLLVTIAPRDVWQGR